MLKRTTEISDYSISEKHLQHRERQRRAMCNSGWFFIPTHKRHITKHFIYIFYISSICFLVFIFCTSKIYSWHFECLYFFFSFFGFSLFFKEDFLGSGTVMGRLYIGAVLAVYLEQGVVGGSYKEQLP